MPSQEFKAYHAHLYYSDHDGLLEAQQLAHEAAEQFNVRVGRFHEKKVGPHPMWTVQISFSSAILADIIPWLIQNRGALDVLLHPLSGDELWDHTQGAFWLGKSHTLDIRQFLPKI